MRIKSHWFRDGRERTPQEIADALAFVAWRIADNALRNTRKADFEIAVGPQYFAFLNEFLQFLIMVADRIAYRRFSAEERMSFTGTLANRLGETYAENESRLLGGTPAASKQRFIEHVNLRAGEYADFGYDEHGPDYTFMRYLAFCMSPIMDAKDSHWIIDQIISIEAPEAVKMVDKTLRDLLEAEPRPARRRNGTSGD
ncbi:hypothetical protein [Ferriphaselus sp. R-1]|uniref:hypothetical protein n=1 Tax=Ferriphaselus sp. R-1 TaxID=1485544 RepID=UPI0005559D4E|nr:hypothetical protein [Ferriphaselus sp. R-1]